MTAVVITIDLLYASETALITVYHQTFSSLSQVSSFMHLGPVIEDCDWTFWPLRFAVEVSDSSEGLALAVMRCCILLHMLVSTY